MISSEKLLLLNAWKSRLFDGLSISEIMKISKKETKPWVFNALKEMVRHNLLITVRKGNMDIYSLNMDNPLLFHILQYLEAQETLLFPRLDVISEAINAIPLKNYCLLVFGSYAEGKQKKDSDLDVCFLIEKQEDEKRIKPYFNESKLNFSIHIDEHYITFDDFVKMLLRPDENLAKQILIKRKLFLNADIYYRLVKEAHEHGFKGSVVSGKGKE